MATITLYQVPRVITLTLEGVTERVGLMNYPVNRTDFKVFRNVDNEVHYFIKDIDRKAIDLTNIVPVFRAINKSDMKIVLEKDLTVVDAERGLCLLEISASDTASLEKGSLDYNVTVTRSDGKEIMLYTDRNYGVHGYLEVIDGPIPQSKEAIELDPDTFTPNNSKTYSSALAGATTVGDDTGLHTITSYLTDFTGTILIQGSLEDQPTAVDSDWFDIDTYSYVAETGTIPMNVTSMALWIRFVLTTTSGSVEKILFKN